MRSQTELDRDGWNRVASVFDRAVDAGPGERALLLDQLCGSDLTIRREVEEMLQAHEQHTGLIAERRLGSDDGARTRLDEMLSEGARVGPYRIVSLIGAGGMGDVYRAERADGAYRQIVALKVLRPGYRTAEMIRRFRIEREALARLVHPGIASILDGGTTDDGRPFIVLQFVDGIPITTYCADHALGLRDRLLLFLRVTSAVQFAHSHLVVHRDIKPSNILVERDGAPRLLDFGIAKLLDRGMESSFGIETKPEARLLTLPNAAPEQLRGDPPSTATDVYALGVLLFEMLTGTKPFGAVGRNAWTLERAIIGMPAPSPSSVVASRSLARKLRGDVDRIVLMALRKEPERRYVSAAQFAEDVERYLAGRPVIAQPDSVRYRAAKFVARNRAMVAGVAAGVLLSTAFGVTATLQARRTARERDRAERERVSAEDAVQILTGIFERANPTKHPGGDTLRVTALLDEAEQAVGAFHDDPARQAALWRTVARMRGARGEYARAIDLMTRALNERRAAFGPEDVEAARMRHEEVLMLVTYRGAAAARPSLDSSVAALRRLLGDEHEDVRIAMSDLLSATTDSVVARALLAQLLDLERRKPSRDPGAIASRLDAQATERYRTGHYAEAAALFEACFEILTRQLPPQDTRVRTAQRDLALALVGGGQLARAESLQRASIALETRLRGSQIDRAMANEALALTLVGKKQIDSAESYEREALRLFRTGTAPEHWRIWSAARNLAFIVAARGRGDEALALLDTAIAIASTGGESGSDVGYLMTQRVPFLLRANRVKEAEQSLADGEHRLGNSPSVSTFHRADVHRYAGMIELAKERPSRAAERFRSAVLLAEPPGEPQKKRGINSCLLGVALAALDRVDEARPLLGAPCTAYESRGLAHPLIIDWIAGARRRISNAPAFARTGVVGRELRK